MHYLLFYEAGTDYAEQRKPFRTAHLQHAQAAVARGELVLGGAFANPIDGAVLIFGASRQPPRNSLRIMILMW